MKEKRTPERNNTDKHIEFKSVGNGRNAKVTLQRTSTGGTGLKVKDSKPENR